MAPLAAVIDGSQNYSNPPGARRSIPEGVYYVNPWARCGGGKLLTQPRGYFNWGYPRAASSEFPTKYLNMFSESLSTCSESSLLCVC